MADTSAAPTEQGQAEQGPAEQESTGQGLTGQDLSQKFFRHLNRYVKPAVKAGLGSPPPIGLGAVVLESTGRVSGKPREVPLLGLRFGDRVVVSTVRSNAQWVKNLEADDSAAVWFCGRKRSATATVRRGPLHLVELASTNDSA